MNYKKIYRSIILKAKSENRTKSLDSYYEKHHVIPTFMFKHSKRNKSGCNCGELSGDHDDINNIVLLTPREHFISHVLLYKMYIGTRYEYQCGSSLMLFLNVGKSNHKRLKNGNFSGVSKKYDRYRKIGIESISKSRTGMMPVKNVTTGEIIGAVPVNDPRVLSGELVHHSKGNIPSKETKEKISIRTSGSRNPNYKEMTDDKKQRVFKCVSNSIVEGHIIVALLIKNIKEEFLIDFKKISSVWILNNFLSYENLINEYNIEMHTDIKYNSYFRSTINKNLASKITSSKCKVTDGNINKTLNITELEEFLKNNPLFKRGMKPNVKNN